MRILSERERERVRETAEKATGRGRWREREIEKCLTTGEGRREETGEEREIGIDVTRREQLVVDQGNQLE